MDSKYTPETIEKNWYKKWEEAGYFEPQGSGDPFCIMLPPPNVTGSLHMGHGFQHTLIDATIRYQRMMHCDTLWQPGTDHAGISTQLVVEKNLEKCGLYRKDMSREEFLDHIWQWKEKSGDAICKQMRRIGSSVDWSKSRFTMDEGLSHAVQKVFIQLYEEGLIYRGTRLVNWDPKLGTAVSDLEVIASEEKGNMWHIRYPINNSDEYIIIATTRPETMLGDVAVAVHPEDERYKNLIGKQLVLPLSERTIPIIADEYVEKDFGTGCVKITPAHDFNDHQIGKRHDLPIINIFTKKATINKQAPIAYQGMDRFVARERIVEDLTDMGLIEKIEPHTLQVPRSEKSNAIIEPLLTDQWYVKVQPLAKPAIDAVKNGDIRFVPENWSKTYFQWMENIEDWCISRQLWWGHRIPAWYDTQGKIYVGCSENDVRFKYKLGKEIHLKQDEDVLDTWFSSALWPFSTLGWPEKTDDFEKFYPTNVLFTGFDIIFFWVARMIMMGLKFTKKIPFKEIVITGLICDSDGKKMSKSKGNVLDPLDIIDGIDLESLIKKRTSNLMLDSVKNKITKETRKSYPDGIAAYGTDALRFTFCSIAATTRQVRFDLQRVEGYRHFCNKLWNAARYVLINTEEEKTDLGDGAFQYSPADKWILSLLQKTIAKCHHHFENYRFDLLAKTLYDFVWHEYCDWYLELSKPILNDPDTIAALKRGTRRTLLSVLDNILKLLHPLIPFITEEIWQKVSKRTTEHQETIMLSRFPKVLDELVNDGIETEFAKLKDIIQSIRAMRAELGLSPAKAVKLQLKTTYTDNYQLVQKHELLLKTLCKISSIKYLEESEHAPTASSAVVHNIELFIPLAGVIDKSLELNRIEKELNKINATISHVEKKLKTPSFVEKAPHDVVKKEEEKLKQAMETQEALIDQQKRIMDL